jgi:hypothetical protein
MPIVLVVCVGCSSPSGPTGNTFFLRTDSTDYKYNDQGIKIIVFVYNHTGVDAYAFFVRGRAIMGLETPHDSIPFFISYPIEDVFHDSVYFGVIPKGSAYPDSLVLTDVSPGEYYMSLRDPYVLGISIDKSNIFSIRP